MSYTFGAGTGDDITATASNAVNANLNACLTVGWWYPTTLTATRGYFSAGNVYGMEVDTTTSELRLRTDNTTDGQWATAGAGITINNWWYIAHIASTTNTGPAAAHRVWVGSASDPPAEVTVSVSVAPSGNFTSSAIRYAGNKGTGTLAFQGDVGWMSQVSSNGAAPQMFGIAAAGTISNAEADLIKAQWVIPLWLGRPNLQQAVQMPATSGFSVIHFPLNTGLVCYHYGHDPAIFANPAVTINGATFSSNFPPRAPPENWPVQQYRYA